MQHKKIPTLSEQMTLLTNVHGLEYKHLVTERLRACEFKRTVAEVMLELYHEAREAAPCAHADMVHNWFGGTDDYVVTPSKSSRLRGV